MPPRGCYSSGVVDPGIPHGFAATRGPKSWAKCAAYSAVTELFACSAWWEVVAAAGHRQDVVEVRRGLRHGLDLRGHLRALTRRRGGAAEDGYDAGRSGDVASRRDEVWLMRAAREGRDWR